MKKLIIAVLCILLLGCAYAEEETAVAEYTAEQIDLDLSVLSGTVVYAQVYNMAMDPESYVGKIVKISGYFDYFRDSETGIVYTACVIPDATACCAQGIEFVWAGEHMFPDDYPEPGVNVTATGLFETYMEGDYMYIHLTDAEVLWETDGPST